MLYFAFNHLGGTRAVVDLSDGAVVERSDYYPYGTRIGQCSSSDTAYPQLSSNRWRYSGKEEQASVSGLPFLDFGARQYDPALGSWLSQDPLAKDYPSLSPYAYCAGDPENIIDPSGCRIIGETRQDAAQVVNDLHEIFRDSVFDQFRSLIVQSGKHGRGRMLAMISEGDLQRAFDGITLTKDQKALVDIVVNTINSNDQHLIEYLNINDNVSSSVEDQLFDKFTGVITREDTTAKYGGFPVYVIAKEAGGGGTIRTTNGTYSAIIIDGEHPNGRALTTGHELFGHARSLALGRTDSQHEDAILTENLILRVMGIQFINDGRNHGDKATIISNPSRLPNYR